MVLICKTLSLLHLRMLCAKLVETGSVSVEKKILKFCQCIFAISYLSPLGNDVALHLNKLESFLPKDALSQACRFKLIGPVVLEKKIFEFYCRIFAIILTEFPPPKDALCQCKCG